MKKKKTPLSKKGWHYPKEGWPVVPSQMFTDDVIVRRLEYLDAVNEMCGSNEGAELESLAHTTQQQVGAYLYEESEKIGDFDNI